MKGDATKINDLFLGPKTSFIIPLYQRNYDWDEKNCKRLFDDLVTVKNKNLNSHFFGSIVACRTNMADEDWLIIDGQQRITTVSLLILALINAAQAHDIACEYPDDIQKIKDNYLLADRKKTHRKIKLRPIPRDMQAYDALFSGQSEEYVKNSKMTRNYLFFYEQIKLSGFTFDELIETVEKLVVVFIRLESGDDPQLIFESLNSTGLDLSEADKVRNYLLMSLSASDQENYYNQYWNKMEECTDYEPTMFIRDYLTVRLKHICTIDNLYFDFKQFDVAARKDRKERLEEMLVYARYYEQIVKGKTGSLRLNKKLRQLDILNSSVDMPFYLAFFHYAKENHIGEDEIFQVLDIIEAYWARRIICNLPANSLAKVFAILHYDVLRIIVTHEKRQIPVGVPYSELLKFVLLKKQGNALFPRDPLLTQMFKTRQIYKLPIDYRYFLFERMENENNPEGNRDIAGEMKREERPISIEHIMPQTLNDDWRKALGDNYAEIHDTYLHTFANLTLTGWNQNYSNRKFTDKKNGYYDNKGHFISGFKDSGYRLSNFLKECDKWTEDEILARQAILLDKFIHLWPMITSTYLPLEKETEIISFDDDEFEYKNRKIAAFIYKGERHDVSTWKQMLIEVCQLVYREHKATMTFLGTKRCWLHDNATSERSLIGDHCYVYSSCDNRTKKAILRYLLEKCGIPFSDLELVIMPLTENPAETDD